MIDHSENTLGAAIKALRFTVAPAVDPGDAQAVEQLRLTIDFLDFSASGSRPPCPAPVRADPSGQRRAGAGR